MDLTVDEVAEILNLLDETSYDELTIETAHRQIVFRRGEGGGWTQETHTVRSRPVIFLEGGAEAARVDADAARNGSEAAAGVIEIRSPLPGTFYRAPRPGADPFVETGSPVGKHTVVAIVETMKLMNSIHAGVEGEVVEVCAANGELVEPTMVLMRVKAQP